ncbi:hypothetical protein [Planococcus halocryophilus]|uniref:MFS transporter n=1 Tax=Planococcus halocryophilus TaxID=1215089 RepID=A0A1C7DN33_9BACL|nr:hypothetical protein [Planococcus halocryophilus]ANU12804.1 hypothetical protein BBI08_02650 [Planococcus halocryophilus]
MIRILIFVILAAVVLPLTYLLFKQVPLAKRMTIAGGGIAAAGIAILMQGAYAWYIVALALLGVSFLAAFVYMKLVEKEQREKLRLVEERRELKQQKTKTYLATTEETPAAPVSTEKPKPFGMQSIDAEREEITRG